MDRDNFEPDFGMTGTGETVRKEKTRKETDEKCPQCGAVLNFDPATGGMACDFCGYRGEIEVDGEAEVAELAFEDAEFRKGFDWGAEKKQVICKSCGASSIYDDLDVANECPFCGSNQVMQEKSVDSLAPGAVAPFVISNEEAGKRFTAWLKSKIFAPSQAKKSAKADRFRGVYLPFWTFDAKTYSRYKARYGIDRIVEDSKGNRRTVTDWYKTSGDYNYFADDILILASTRQSERELRRIEPYDHSRLVPYRPEYLAGFISERYSLGIDDGWTKAKERIGEILDGEITALIKSRHRADRVAGLTFDTTFSERTYKYLLLPVWMSSFKFKEKIYHFLVNGQTGKVAGSTPISPWRVLIAILLTLIVFFFILYFTDNLPFSF
jgi:DNA-directed RNA polymerase subunit RPC12/RpoP